MNCDSETCIYCEEAFEHNDESPEVWVDRKLVGYSHKDCLEEKQYREGV